MNPSDEAEATYHFSHLGKVNVYYVRSEQKEGPALPPPQEVIDLKVELGMPQESVWRRLFTGGAIFGDRWRKYKLVFLGMLVEHSAYSNIPGLYWRITDRSGNPIETIQLWFQRVCHPESPVCCELRWHPERGETVTFTDIENAKRERDITLAWRGKALLQKVERMGRSANSFNLTQDEFMERAPKAFGNWLNTFGEEPTDVQLAEELGISRATLYRYLKSYDLTIHQIRAKGRDYSS
jgi:hypothetical protein